MLLWSSNLTWIIFKACLCISIRLSINLWWLWPQRSKFMGQRSNFQHGPMEMKFNRDDPYGILSMLKILWRSFKVIKESLWRHFRLDTKCSNWVEIWYEWSLSQFSRAKNILGSFKVIKGCYDVTSGLIQNAHIELKFDMNGRFAHIP